jgi:hypothetical protein
MNTAFLTQLLISGAAIAALIGLSAWLGVPRDAGTLDEAKARRLLAEEFPEAPVHTLWLSADGGGALAKCGGEALIVYRAGDGHVIRSAPWSIVGAGVVNNGRAVLKLDDVTAPRAAFKLAEGASWPPTELTA